MQSKFTPKFKVGDLIQTWLEGEQVLGIVIDLEQTIKGNLTGWCKVAILKGDRMVYRDRYSSLLEGQRGTELLLVSHACG